jgi:hypothetical protein
MSGRCVAQLIALEPTDEGRRDADRAGHPGLGPAHGDPRTTQVVHEVADGAVHRPSCSIRRPLPASHRCSMATTAYGKLMGGLYARGSPGTPRIRRSVARPRQPDGGRTPGRPGPSPRSPPDGQRIPPLACVAEMRARASSAVIQFATVLHGWAAHREVRRAAHREVRRAAHREAHREVRRAAHREVRRAAHREVRRAAHREVRRALPTLPGRTSPPSAARRSPRCATRSTGPSALPKRPGCGLRARRRTRRHAAAP